MINRCTIQVLRVLAGAALAVFLQGAVAPRAAQASCGDYVHFGSHMAHHAAGALQMGGAGRVKPGHDSNASRRTSENSTPCRGAACSRGGQMPATPAVPVEVSAPRWGISGQGLVSIVVGSQTVTPMDDAPHAHWQACALYRPPR